MKNLGGDAGRHPRWEKYVFAVFGRRPPQAKCGQMHLCIWPYTPYTPILGERLQPPPPDLDPAPPREMGVRL